MNNSDIIKQTDIKKVIQSETGLTFKKNTLDKCPFCNSGNQKNGTSAFSVQPQKNIFKCFSCGKSGNPVEFIRFFKNVDTAQAFEYIGTEYAGETMVKPTANEPETDLSKTIYAIKRNGTQPATDYLKSRNIDTDKLPAESYFYDTYLKAVVFIDTDKQLINKRLIEPEPDKPKSVFAKNSSLKNALYAKTYNGKSDFVFITEGVINALSFYPYSALAIFSTTNEFTDVPKLARYLKNKKVVLAFDNDAKTDTEHNAGKKATDYYSNFILKNIEIQSLSVLNFAPNVDANDLHKENKLHDFLKDTDNYDFLKIDILKKPLLQNSKEPDKDFKEHSFYVSDSKYFIKEYAYKKTIPKKISDFVFESLYRLSDTDGTRLIKAQQETINGVQRIELLQVTSKELTKENFKHKLYSIGFNFIGTQPDLERILMYHTHREKQADFIETYGYQTDSKMFVFSDSAINSSNELIYPNSIGMLHDTKTNKLYYLPSASPANENELKEFRKEFSYKAGTLDFKEFARLFYQSNKLNGSIGIMFYLLSIFRDIITRHLDFFPYLFLYGTAGGGKTSYSEILTSLFGDTSKGVDLKNITQPALSRIASQKRNTIVYYKEYKTDAQPFVEQYFKAGYDCVSRTISESGTGTKTKSFTIESAGLLDANFLPTNEEAVFTRMIILDFENHNFTDTQKDAFRLLLQHKENGLSQITREIFKHRELFESNFKEVFYSVLDELKAGKMNGFKDRERAFKHVALILTPFHILNSVLKFPFDIDTLENIMVAHAQAQYEKLTEFKSISVFWQSLSYFKSENKVKEYGDTYAKDKAHYYKDTNASNKSGVLYIKSTKLSDLHAYYVSYCKQKSIPYDSFSELKSKLLSEAYKPFLKNKADKKNIHNNYRLGSSYAFEYELNTKDNSLIFDGFEVEL